MSKPITELSNEFSGELDGKLDAGDFLKILRACDSQIFSGWKHHSSLLDEDILESCEFVASYCAKLITNAIENTEKKVAIVMTGCGTSGRIAFLTARRYNEVLAACGIRPLFHYLISGGDSALLLSDELPEDDPVEGAADLATLVEDCGVDGTFLIGVTCGLSAPYVAGQLHHALEDSTHTIGAAVMGFNPTSLARNAVIEKAVDKWTFRNIAERLEQASKECQEVRRFAMLNPVVGPEPIAGSSRMKGGSATAVMLDAICYRSIVLAGIMSNRTLLGSSITCKIKHSSTIADVCLTYQAVHSQTYHSGFNQNSLPVCMQRAADSLKTGGRVLFVGAKSAGCMAFIDASEMPDTYGSPFDQIRGFVDGGWGSDGVKNVSGDISHVSSLHRISCSNFQTDLVPNLCAKDTVVFVVDHKTLSDTLLALANVVQSSAPVLVLGALNRNVLTPSSEEVMKSLLNISTASSIVDISQEMDGVFDYSLKLMLNAVSTYAQAAGRGAVYKGLMVTTGPANDKIYNRCVEIISHTTQVSMQRAEIALLKAIHKVDVVTDDLLQKPRSFHIKASILPPDMRHCAQTILPLSMLMATGKWGVAEAVEALRMEPRVSVLLDTTVLRADSQSSQQQAKEDQFVVLFDMGGTNLRVATATRKKSVFQMNNIHTYKLGDDKCENTVKNLLENVYKKSLQADGFSVATPPSCVVMAQPGHVDETNGTISSLVNFPWSAPFPMKRVLKEISNCEDIFIVDDCDAALYGEVKSKSSPSPDETIVMLTIGTGIGCSVFSNNILQSGSRHLIEGGHMILHPNGLHCPCGQQGCLEMYSSGSAIGASGKQRGISASTEGSTTAEDVVREAEKGNEVATSIIREAAKNLAIGLVNITRLLDPHMVIIGGGIGGILFKEMTSNFANMTWNIHDDVRDVCIVPASCVESGLMGCLKIAEDTLSPLK